jgi:AspT/YidE/YbjL antiporter-like protein
MFDALLNIPSALQAVTVISLICAVGLALGKVRVLGVSLGIAFVFFAGIMAGSIGLSVDTRMLSYCETFGLVLFVYTLGLHVGPNFFGSLRHEGMQLNAWAFAVIILGTVMAMLLTLVTPISIPDMVGVLCGATTNTPALGAAQQALKNAGMSGGSAALATAVTYPLGVLGVILAIIVLRKCVVKPGDLEIRKNEEDDETYIAQFVVTNPALEDRTIAQLKQITHLEFIISRIWRGRQVIVPFAETQLHLYDNILVVTKKEEAETLTMLFGEKTATDWNREQIDWNHIDSKVESHIIVLTRTVLNGKRLGQLRLRDVYGVNVSRVLRGDVKLLATDDLRLQYGDRLTVVGEPKAVEHAERYLGNSVKTLNEPNVGSIFLGMILGLILGTIPILLPGMDAPVRLGIAGGPIIMGILVGALGPRMHFISYTTRSASLMLRRLGLALYLACLGLDAGSGFLETVVRPEGLLWIGAGFMLTILPVIIIGTIALHTRKFDFGTICGILCGSMANPMALTYADDTIKGDTPSISYATVYPLSMFVRVIIAQVIIMFFT